MCARACVGMCVHTCACAACMVMGAYILCVCVHACACDCVCVYIGVLSGVCVQCGAICVCALICAVMRTHNYRSSYFI